MIWKPNSKSWTLPSSLSLIRARGDNSSPHQPRTMQPKTTAFFNFDAFKCLHSRIGLQNHIFCLLYCNCPRCCVCLEVSKTDFRHEQIPHLGTNSKRVHCGMPGGLTGPVLGNICRVHVTRSISICHESKEYLIFPGLLLKSSGWVCTRLTGVCTRLLLVQRTFGTG